ncbi:aquaporin [Kordiimonas lacus]|uniref:Glycerol uptake facilitator (Major Intrinsic Protein Family) n=1 Tax=Kordiimonas lacus TaxID=637679 RepID=A0A1G6ZY55_9PROT|nr:MIP/aquaporin family protein [Kordiimonas lacus]SDE06566.1 Glycerol uptake facilitator (Major Intrinsic Protein Family) [Kordiimonas lacus]
MTMTQKLVAEFVGTLMLLATVVGSGIMGETLAAGNDAVALWGNTAATGAILVVLIMIFGPFSGAHFNPAVTLVFFAKGQLTRTEATAYILTQIVAGVAGVMLAHAMFDQAIVQTSLNVRTGTGQWISEGVATFGLLAAILGTVRYRPEIVPYAVGLYITAGYWFTASTSFANPAVTIARSFTNTFSGIAPADVLAFIAAQIVGAFIALFLFKILETNKVDA